MRRDSSLWNWVIYIGSGVIGVILSLIAFGAAQGGDHCHPATARATQIVYKPTGHNTWVTLIAYCDGTAPTAWSISFFEGEQPDLWDWWEIQNTAGELLRGY